ncbi:hypothetical protein CVIRNUC_005411 [Coccomyxa viridis]|uniref:glutaredoxin-dependent peroxiredoxin n=1 Tax=Coccomyxa viridis TaxID=1274662 RepID=A0AAV1I8R7_9CHLO|nr:hypothetical protein CVIRNUC_005411 [Coccomyxa viridis]
MSQSLWPKLLRSSASGILCISLQLRKGVSLYSVRNIGGKLGSMRGASLLLRLAHGARSSCAAKAFTTDLPAAQQFARCFTSIPAGHRNSDLREEVCNVGLNRRRDLMMRGDIQVDLMTGKQRLKDLLKGQISVICGLPDMGKVCEEHVKGFIDKADALKSEGVKTVMIMAVDDAAVIDKWLKDKHGDSSSNVEAVGDDAGAFTRMLGVNINDPERSQKTQRFSALIDNGILLKLRVEESCGKIKESDADAILGIFKDLKTLKEAA